MKWLISNITVAILVLVSHTAKAATPTTLYNSITFDDGTTVTEAVDFTKELTKAIKSDAKLPKTLTDETTGKNSPKKKSEREKTGETRVTNMMECMAEVNAMRDKNGRPLYELDTLTDKKRLEERIRVFGEIFYYLADNDVGTVVTLFKKYKYPKRYEKRFQVLYKLDMERYFYVKNRRHLNGTEEFFHLRNLYFDLIDDLVRESLFERNAMSKFEVALYKADRCKMMAVGKDPDLIKEHVSKIAKKIDELWTGYYAKDIRIMKRNGKLRPND